MNQIPDQILSSNISCSLNARTLCICNRVCTRWNRVFGSKETWLPLLNTITQLLKLNPRTIEMLKSPRELQLALSFTMDRLDQIPRKRLNPSVEVSTFFKKHPRWNLGNIRNGIVHLDGQVSMVKTDHPVIAMFNTCRAKKGLEPLDPDQADHGSFNGNRADIERCVTAIETILRKDLLSNVRELFLDIPMNIIPGCIQLQSIPQKDGNDGD